MMYHIWWPRFVRGIIKSMDFTTRYSALNTAQKQAVDTIDGPVMVIAGPGTGKTELLSLRAANILRTTDTLPENILCLTFTDSGANAMRERLVSIIGKDAYKVAIHTFHSFGSEVINQFGEYFYAGAHFRPADELSRYEIIRTIFDSLGHNNVLNKKMNGAYTYLSDSLTVISELKKSGLTSDELLIILDANDVALEKTAQLLSPIFASKPSKAMIDQLAVHIEPIRASAVAVDIPSVVPLATIIADSLEHAVDTAQSTGKTTSITAWRNAWFKKDENGVFVLKSTERQSKLRAVSSIYEQYLARMQEAELYDFDDMILRVVHAMEVFDELRFNLQERYQYIMVDEFQDTNMAQMRIVHNLTNNEAQGDTPNIMVVGDDDQAIYSFQGADISNIIDFRTNYPKARIITLTDNYRSGEVILASARSIIVQGSERLENYIDEVTKILSAHTAHGPGTASLFEAESSADERHWLVESIKSDIAAGTSASDIAVLTRKHAEIEKLLPYFVRANIAVQYERRDNVLDLAPIVLIEQLARVLNAVAAGQHDIVNGHLPELLAHPAWAIDPVLLWQLSLKAYQNHTHWLDEMARIPELLPLQTWLITTALASIHTPLESILDVLIGSTSSQSGDTEHDDADPEHTPVAPFVSPLYNYYFSADALASHTDEYVRYLEALRAIRTKLRDYRPLDTPDLQSFITFITLHRTIGSGITSVRSASTAGDGVNIMTAHKSKGLEFDTVYITNAIDSVWGERARSRVRQLSYPENLPLAPLGDSSDERLRLFYVAATRAKKVLNISFASTGDGNKSSARAGFLVGDGAAADTTIAISSDHNQTQALETAELQWYESLVQSNHPDLRTLLAPQLERYQLSVTHLTNFLDVTRGGPQNFLLQNLLRFPQSMSPASAYGTAIHATLNRAHAHLVAEGKRQAVEDILHNFETSLSEQHLSAGDFELYLQKGSEDLQAFLHARYNTFTNTQKSELNFKSQHVIVGDAHLSGALDLVDVSPSKSVVVTDYKTGKATRSWIGKTDYEKIKLHKYKQQLMFYKLLIENARDFRGHTVTSGILQFVEPTATGAIVDLQTEFDDNDQQRFVQLINAIWNRIITLDLPDISTYDPSLKGILAFEQDLIDGSTIPPLTNT
jgi:DNA helicase II / ATP-dependent DNA helicase PcrA